MGDFCESRGEQMFSPCFPVIIAAVALFAPALFVIATGIGAKQNTVGFERQPKLFENSRQFLAWHVKERCIGEDAVEIFCRQAQFKKILAPHFAATISSRQLDEAFRSLDPDRLMAQLAENFQVSARPATEIEYPKRSWTVKALQQRVAILADIVIARALPETVSVGIVVGERNQ